LLPRVLSRSPSDEAVCIVQSKFMPLARDRAAAIVALRPAFTNRIRLVEGDITERGLALREKIKNVSEIYHFAAVYDLSVKREVGMRVNVDGTRNVLEFATAQPNLRRLQYISTCYVSGRIPAPSPSATSTNRRPSTTTTKRPSSSPKSTCRRR
jgi:nucleoside-diphosphate-sugar epimerase